MDEFQRRLGEAKKARNHNFRDEARDAYRYCFNGREREWDDRPSKDEEPEEIFGDMAGVLAEEFAGELFSTLTPQNAPWVEYEAPAAKNEQEVAAEEVTMFEGLIADAIQNSNYYDEGPTAFSDAVVGNVVMWVERPSLMSPIVCEAVPLPECYFTLGPFGIDSRFRKRPYHWSVMNALFPDAQWNRDQQKKIKEGKGTGDVVWGFWANYADPDNPVWRQEIRVDGKPIGLDEDLGEVGAVPMLVGRFNPVPGSPWGVGPGRKLRNTMRANDELVAMLMEGVDRQLDPAYIYPHDGMLDFSDGIESGMAYPSMPGSAESIRALGVEGNLDVGFFSQEKFEEMLRYGFFRQEVQKGKTPPSASQYMGEEQKVLRRMARPAVKLWREFGVGFLKRVEYLERQPGGSMVDVDFPLLDGGRIIAKPISPLERAQAREEVLVAQSIMQMAMESLGPEQAPLVIDGPKTMGQIKEKLKDKLVAFRTQEEIQAILQAMQPQQQGAPNEGP